MFNFEEDFFGVDVSGVCVGFEDIGFVEAAGGGLGFVGTLVVDSFEAAALDDFVFEGEAPAFASDSMLLLFFGVVVVGS